MIPYPENEKYIVTPEGHIIGPRGYVLKEQRDGHGYHTVGVGRLMVSVHVMVARAYHGPRPPGMDVCHVNGDKDNNHPDNLVYDTRRRNNLDKARHGKDHNASKTHCINGHELSAENVYVYTGRGKTERQCRKCRRANQGRRVKSVP